MKKQILSISTIIFIIFLTISCGKKESNPAPALSNTNPNTNTTFLKAKVDGAQYQTDAPSGVLANTTIARRITITSQLSDKSDKRNFQLVLKNPAGVGSYTYPTPSGSDYSLNMIYADNNASASIYSMDACPGMNGTLTISAISDTEMSGTFSFSAKSFTNCSLQARLVTEGSFKSFIIQ